MSGPKDRQAPDSPTQSSGLPFKKRSFEEMMSSNDNRSSSHVTNKFKLELLQKEAYYDVLYAFIAESPSISSAKFLLIKDLMKEWNIDYKTHSIFDDKIRDHRMVRQLWEASLTPDEKEKLKAIDAAKQKTTGVEGNPVKLRLKQEKVIAPAKIQDGKVIPLAKIQEGNVTASDVSPVPSWGQVAPESLVSRWIEIRLPDEEDYIAFLIKQFDAESDMHHLVSALSREDFSDPCDWIDLRHIPVEDIVWKEEHPGFPIRKSFLKPGETLLHTTSTATRKKQLREVGKSATGIPIIKKIDKGKGIAK